MRKITSLSLWTGVLLIIGCLFSCTQKTAEQTTLTNAPAQTVNTINSTDLPPPIKAKYLDPNSIAPPKVIPLKYKPTVIPAHPNVHPIGTPKVTQIPKELHIVTLGKEVPMPEIISVIPAVSPVFQSKVVPALNSRMKDAAIYNIQCLSADEGLVDAGNTIMEDRKGYIWISSNKALIRYDGKNFFHYTWAERLGYNFRKIIEDSQGNIWFTAPDGFGYFDGKMVVHFDKQEGLEQHLWLSIFEDSKKQIWVNSNKGVLKYKPDENRKNFTFFKKENGLINSARKESGPLFDNRINTTFEDNQGHIWWATQGNGVLRYDPDNNQGQIIQYTETEGLISNYIKCIFEDSKGQIWFGGGGEGTSELQAKGISIYNRDAATPESLGGTFTNYTTNEGLSGNRITDIVEDEWGKVWLATFRGGLTCYDPSFNNQEGRFIHYTTKEGLSNNSITMLQKDSNKNIWIGPNFNSGINRFNPNSFRHITDQHGLSKNWINGFLEDSKGNIWMGTSYGGLMKYDGHNFINYSEKENLLEAFPTPLLEDKQGNIWFRTREKGLALFDGNNFKSFGVEQGFISPNIDQVNMDKQGRIWINARSIFGVMLIRYNPKTGEVAHFSADHKGGIGAGIFKDKQQQLWFGGKDNIAKYDAINDQLNYVLQLDVESPGLNVSFDDGKDNLWFNNATHIYNATHLFKMKKDGDNSTIPSFSIEQAFPNMSLRGIAVDKNQKIWFSTLGNGIGVMPHGIESLSLSEPDWILNNKKDGLKSLSYYGENTYIDSKNRLWVVSLDAGVTMLDLNTYEIPSTTPKNLSLSHIDIQQKPIDFERLKDSTYSNTLAFGAVLKESFDSVVTLYNYPKNLSLPYDLNHLTFHFSAIDWNAPHDIRYSYKMKSLDKEWSPLSTKAEADYRNMPYGTHTFQVKAIGKAQVWSAPFDYTFTILPPWWHTWWAYGLYALLTIGTAGYYVQRLRQQIKQKQAQLDKELYLNRELAVTNNKLAEINVANSRFVPNDFLKILGKESLLDLRLGDQTETTMTILFADIRDYTTLSEKMTPEDNFKLINAFLGKMGPIIEEHGGFICQFLGDGIMALFNDNHELAVKAAIEMQQALQLYNKKRFVRNREILRLGIGLNTGKLMLGVVGDKNHYESSVISDAVNTASRMEGLTKIFGCGVIVSEKTLAEIAATKVGDTLKVSPTLTPTYRFLGKVKVKGKKQALKIYDFYAGDATNIRQLKAETKADFEKAIHHYLNREFGKAADILKRIAEKFPEDVATEYYLTKAVKYVIDGVDADWNGVEAMINK